MIKFQYQAVIFLCVFLIVSQFFLGLYLDNLLFHTNGVFAFLWGWGGGFFLDFLILKIWAKYTMKSNEIDGVELSKIVGLKNKSIIFKLFSKIK